ncbi:E3 ubiquitin-protein ligase ZNRF1 isoform X2 [Protopterus annectens]|uniref:E3 ubiquitin-protein ligase ZNRF1 isoform X2 n=1 Tax=Protopterus annectens TaxID=7888 RepID=UPI001CF9E43B|nr:E3 ubiquitin-protein ligase ZNRF1 isoform X2 [Protopterus annectens]
MGGKQSTAARSRGPFAGVSTDDSVVPTAPSHFGHYQTGGPMGLRSRSVSSVTGMGIDSTVGVPFGLYPGQGTSDPERGDDGSAADSTSSHGNSFQETGGSQHTDGVLYLGSRGSLADALPLHIAPRWFSAHSDDVLNKDAGECVICLEDLVQGDTIARLPCLCIYHKSCIDSWFEVNRSCPEHPSD